MIPARGGGNGVSGGGLRRFGGFLFFSLVLLAAVVARGCFCGRGLFFCGLEFLDVGATRIRRVEAGTFKHYAHRVKDPADRSPTAFAGRDLLVKAVHGLEVPFAAFALVLVPRHSGYLSVVRLFIAKTDRPNQTGLVGLIR